VVSAVMAVVMVRKRRSAKSSLRAKADALTPPSDTRLHEIAEEIVDHLRPWKDGKGYDEITLAVDRELRILLVLARHEAIGSSDRKQNRSHAQKLDRALLSVETLLGLAPLPLRDFLLHPLPNMDFLAAEFIRLREVCARAVDPGFGYHPNYDRLKRFCARFAHGVMLDLSDRAITGTKDGAFRTIASLLYEAISGQSDADLKRACDSELRDIRGRELGTE
jgi:hypothetical protein